MVDADQWLINKILSGGQTGADCAALDWAHQHRVAHGGWCPKGRLAVDGPLPEHTTSCARPIRQVIASKPG